MYKRTRNQSSLLSLGVKRIRCGGNEGENRRAESASEQPADDPHDDGYDHIDQDDTDTIDEIMECSSDCCEPDHEGPNQLKSHQILAATKRVQSHQARYIQGWFSQHPWLTLCETRNKLFYYYCSIAERRKLMTFSSKVEDTF